MAELVYLLCTLMSVGCSVMLWRGYYSSQSRLLLWSAASFGLLAVNCVLLFLDLVVFPNLDFHGPVIRQALGAASGSVLLFGLIWEIS